MWLHWTVVAFYHQQTRNLSCLWKTSNTTGDSTRGASEVTSQLPWFPLNLPRKPILEGSWWQQHTETSQRDELMDTNTHSHLSVRQLLQEHRSLRSSGGGGMKSREIQGIHSQPLPQGWGAAAYPPNPGRFTQPAARVFLQGTIVQRCIMITRAPRCLNRPVQSWTRKLSFFCLLKILSQLKADKAALEAGAAHANPWVGVFVLTHISPPSRHFSAFIFIAEVF